MGTRTLSAYSVDAASFHDDVSCPSPSLEECVAQKRAFFVFKRCSDVVLSVAALIVLSPVFLITSCAIVLDDGFPVFFTQERVGYGGKSFRIFKFRSMKNGAEKRLNSLLVMNEVDGPAFKIKHDPRLTRVGRFIRKVSIDELPQLVNVVKGEMSIVGPRPNLPSEAESYSDQQRMRLLVKPGLTCLWQVSPDRNSVPFDEWMQSDLEYVRSCSVATDVAIIAKTFRVIVNAEGW